MNTYKIQMYVKCREDRVDQLRKELVQSIYDEFGLDSVFSVSVDMETPPESAFNNVMALCMVELEEGLHERQVKMLLSLLPADKDYMPIEFHENNTSAYGFIESEYYQLYDYTPDFIKEKIDDILCDRNLETPDGLYFTPDGRQFCMDYFNDFMALPE
jgi:hypothetical protein